MQVKDFVELEHNTKTDSLGIYYYVLLLFKNGYFTLTQLLNINKCLSVHIHSIAIRELKKEINLIDFCKVKLLTIDNDQFSQEQREQIFNPSDLTEDNIIENVIYKNKNVICQMFEDAEFYIASDVQTKISYTFNEFKISSSDSVLDIFLKTLLKCVSFTELQKNKIDFLIKLSEGEKRSFLQENNAFQRLLTKTLTSLLISQNRPPLFKQLEPKEKIKEIKEKYIYDAETYGVVLKSEIEWDIRSLNLTAKRQRKEINKLMEYFKRKKIKIKE